ncbi:hypothetical protein TeGR_g1132 [Tetraparma gracilis]|uniref:Uncharacterized protein n=1 Tax=Tetraparma gracilis TaxID=2962635 RepID=A0ABQ6M9B3_9STRA|nr:hypothetical protein TeGR_g1132 [Tetraparma gracilis]
MPLVGDLVMVHWGNDTLPATVVRAGVTERVGKMADPVTGFIVSWKHTMDDNTESFLPLEPTLSGFAWSLVSPCIDDVPIPRLDLTTIPSSLLAPPMPISLPLPAAPMPDAARVRKKTQRANEAVLEGILDRSGTATPSKRVGKKKRLLEYGPETVEEADESKRRLQRVRTRQRLYDAARMVEFCRAPDCTVSSFMLWRTCASADAVLYTYNHRN